MALKLEIPFPTGALGIWLIEESIEELRSPLILANLEEQEYAQIQNPERKRQWLAARVLLKQLLKRTDYIKVEVDEHRKPFIDGEEWHFSLSHTQQYAAAIISNQSAVGIDIEHISDRVIRIKDKFLSEAEQQLLPSKDALNLMKCWAAKEAVYKSYGKKGVDFKEHLPITTYNENEQTLEISMKKIHHQTFNVKFLIIENLVVAYTLGN